MDNTQRKCRWKFFYYYLKLKAKFQEQTQRESTIRTIYFLENCNTQNEWVYSLLSLMGEDGLKHN